MAQTKRSVRLFHNGRNQPARIPREFELPGNQALMRKAGDALIIVARRQRSLLETLESLKPPRETFPPIRTVRPSRSTCRCRRTQPSRTCLGTNIVAALVREPRGRVTRRIVRVGEGEVCTSIIVARELRFGAAEKVHQS